ncbi:2-isopropylmalate synthase [Nonomuraea rubra]|uniref:2-isopropylmalate synthase n=1 Tax=Nonomuraea rubra TaxID=46180 RepID=A0A7X0NPL4_9ACTN|nr:2-isopropylmalate synthase [Nonomuraea rubra]MBB6547283.1 2-isopropylmalate synthase [Nonomuraea rubra]
MPFHRYSAAPALELPDRTWPDRPIVRAPLWCSVDLRDGNQALAEPMDLPRKHKMFALLCRMGFKQIEVGFPAASQIDFDFVRELVELDLVPDDVTIQVITQARAELIERTFEAVDGARQAIVHLYNSTSPLQRRVVFDIDRAGAIDLAVSGTRLCTKLAEDHRGGVVSFEYTAESFSSTEPDFALEICEAVMTVWQPAPDRPIIVNLPATVECAPPNVFADQIEWMHRNLSHRESVCLSVHPHNDRGSGIAAAELAVMAGADRVEGCLFGNGERTGNVCLVTLGMNLFAQGIDPMLDLSDLGAIRQVAEECTRIPVHPRHPYAGDLVYTAFSGSHQDAIKKGFESMEREAARLGRSPRQVPWAVPYLPIDPADVGRTYEAVIRVNSQSGKGGTAYLLQSRSGLALPRRLQVEFARTVQRYSESHSAEVDTERIWELFGSEYLRPGSRLTVAEHTSRPAAGGPVEVTALVSLDGGELRVSGSGPDVAAAFAASLAAGGLAVRTSHLEEQVVGEDTAVYAECVVGGETLWGVGLAADPARAAVLAVASAVNRTSAQAV